MKNLKLQLQPKETRERVSLRNMKVIVCKEKGSNSIVRWWFNLDDYRQCSGNAKNFEFGRYKWIGGFYCTIDTWPSYPGMTYRTSETTTIFRIRDEIAICEASFEGKSAFKAAKYYKDRRGSHNWSVYLKKSGWGWFSQINKRKNKIKIKSFKVDYCLSNCEEGIAEYVKNAPDRIYEMQHGMSVTADLLDTCKLQWHKKSLASTICSLIGEVMITSSNGDYLREVTSRW